MAKFCTKCGSSLDAETGLCPACDKETVPEIKSDEIKSDEIKADEVKADEVKANEIKADEVKADEVKTDEIKADETAESIPEEAPAKPACEDAPKAEAPEAPASKFCTKCGSAKDPVSGKCPVCDAAKSEPAPAAKAAPAPELKRNGKIRPFKKRHPILIVLIVLLSIILTATTIVSVVLLGVSRVASGDVIKNIVNDIKISDILDKAMDNGNETIDKFLGELEAEHDIKATVDDIDAFLENSSIKEFASDKISSLATTLIKGDSGIEIKKSEIVDIIMDNQKYIAENFDQEISKEDAQEIADSMFKGDSIEILSKEDINKYIDPSISKAVNLVVSPTLSIAFIIACVVIIALMVLCYPSKAACCVGGIYITLGAIFTAASLLATSVITALVDIPFVNVIIENALSTFLISGIVLLAVGIIALTIRGIVAIVRVKKLSAK